MLDSRLWAIGLCLLADVAAASEAEDVFESLFGARVMQVQATREASDDIELAGEIIAAARQSADTPRLVAILCERAYDLSSRTGDGYPTAIESMRVLGELVPDQRIASFEKSRPLHLRLYSAARGEERVKVGETLIDLLADYAAALSELDRADEAADQYQFAVNVAKAIDSDRQPDLQRSLTKLREQQRLDSRIKLLKGRLEKNREDHDAGQHLVNLYLVDLDDPAQARKYAFLIEDEAERQRITWATMPVTKLDADLCLEMGKWHKSLGDRASGDAKTRQYFHAREYLNRYLALYQEKDLSRKSAELLVVALDRELEGAAPATLDAIDTRSGLPAEWRLLNRQLQDINEWEIQGGKWVIEDGVMRGQGASNIRFKHALPENYDLTMAINVVKGMRPRIWFRGPNMHYGNEGFEKHFWMYGPGALGTQGRHLRYENGQVIELQMKIRGLQHTMIADGKVWARGHRPASEKTFLELSAGDGWSPGTVEFTNLKILPPDDAKADE